MEAPVNYNPERDVNALSRFEDVERGLVVDRDTFISGNGVDLRVRSGCQGGGRDPEGPLHLRGPATPHSTPGSGFPIVSRLVE